MRKSKAGSLYIEVDQEELDILNESVETLQQTKTTIIRSLIRNYAKADQQQQLRAIAQLEGLKDEGEVMRFLLARYNATKKDQWFKTAESWRAGDTTTNGRGFGI